MYESNVQAKLIGAKYNLSGPAACFELQLLNFSEKLLPTFLF
jgi:hypothetical protein